MHTHRVSRRLYFFFFSCTFNHLLTVRFTFRSSISEIVTTHVLSCSFVRSRRGSEMHLAEGGPILSCTYDWMLSSARLLRRLVVTTNTHLVHARLTCTSKLCVDGSCCFFSNKTLLVKDMDHTQLAVSIIDVTLISC